MTVIPDRPRDSQTSDSDSDGPILYRDEEEDDDDDEFVNSTDTCILYHRGRNTSQFGDKVLKASAIVALSLSFSVICSL